MKHAREVRQLWAVAKWYFEEAKKLKIKHIEYIRQCTATDIAKYYEAGVPTGKFEKEVSLLGAHLSSAAIRLCTINERFVKDGIGEIIKDYMLEFRKHKRDLIKKGLWNRDYFEAEFRKNIAMYLPHMLRDNVAHRERGEQPKYRDIWHTRQDVIESVKVIEIFKVMKSTLQKFEKELINKKFIS